VSLAKAVEPIEIIIIIIIYIFKVAPNSEQLLQGPVFWRGDNDCRIKKCNSESNSFVAAAEQACLQPFGGGSCGPNTYLQDESAHWRRLANTMNRFVRRRRRYGLSLPLMKQH